MRVSARQGLALNQAVLIKAIPLIPFVLARPAQIGMVLTAVLNARPVAHGMNTADNAYVMHKTNITIAMVFTAKQIVAHKGNLMCRVLITARTLAVQVAQEKHTTLMQV
jgi:hypothetical protein